MDYTTTALVKSEGQILVSTFDTLISTLVTRASRAIDKYCTGASDGDNYFELDDVEDELVNGTITSDGNLVCYPHKPIINSVASLSYRQSPLNDYVEVQSGAIQPFGPKVTGFLNGQITTRNTLIPGPVYCLISYNGGLADAVAGLPADLIEAATVLTIRFFKEAEGGLNDAIGVAELGTLIYTKAMPVRVAEMLKPYKRVIGWRHLA